MKINHVEKTIHYGNFELVAAVNYIEHVVEQKDKKLWKLVPMVTTRQVPPKKARKD